MEGSEEASAEHPVPLSMEVDQPEVHVEPAATKAAATDAVSILASQTVEQSERKATDKVRSGEDRTTDSSETTPIPSPLTAEEEGILE